jgi:integrase
MRTLPTGYELPMREADTPLNVVVEQFFARNRLQWKTARGYRYTFEVFNRWRAGATLADLNPRTVEDFADQFRPSKPKQAPYNARNKLVALKSLASYLAERRDWYAKPGYLSVLAGLKLPPIPKLGRRPYEDAELCTVVRIAAEGKFGLRDHGIVTLQLATTLRADETRTLQLRDYVRGSAKQLGHIFVRESKTEAGIRQIPLDSAADRALSAYIARGRPTYKGDGPEPIFLTDNGTQFTYWGWTSLARRIGERMRAAGFIGFMQHRARGSTAKLLQRRGVPLNVIQQIGGWEGPEMVRRYIGDYSVEELKTFPTVGLDEILTPDKDRGLPKTSLDKDGGLPKAS